MTVTDLFWMSDDRLGVAGVLADGSPVRLRLGDGWPDQVWLDAGEGNAMLPFCTVRLWLGETPPDIHPPVVEDRLVAPRGHHPLTVLDRPEIAAFVDAVCVSSVQEVFGAPIHVEPGGGKDWYVRSGEGERSLGTVKIAEVQSITVRHGHDEGYMDFRIAFRDETGESYKLPIGDITIQNYLAGLQQSGYTSHVATRALRDTLRLQPRLYARLALEHPALAQPDRCYLQVAGLIALPDPEDPHPFFFLDEGRRPGRRSWR